MSFHGPTHHQLDLQDQGMGILGSTLHVEGGPGADLQATAAQATVMTSATGGDGAGSMVPVGIGMSRMPSWLERSPPENSESHPKASAKGE
jgi:hypothetical protein